MAKTAPALPKGTRDFLPRDLVLRNRAFALLRATFERYGFEPLETPAVELTSVLEGKYGEEGDRLLFRVLKRGHDLESAGRAVAALPEDERGAAQLARELSDMALRYDLTVPFARVVAAHLNDLALPFRRYQMQPVWRGDRPQKGRYREFYQCDVDCVGSRSVTVEAEMLAMVNELFSALGFAEFTIHINHRALLDALQAVSGVPADSRVAVLTAIDKLDKIGADGVREELAKTAISADALERLMAIVALTGTPRELIARLRPLVGESREGVAGLDDLEALFGYLEALGVPPARYAFDLAMVRGLAYYTGTIYETTVTRPKIGTLSSGGRYDRLIGQFLGRDLPCVGVSFGLDRMFDAMAELGLLGGDETTTTQALVTLFGPETTAAAFALARDLRAAGIRTEVYAEPKELRPQLAFASKKGIPLALILGPDELARGEVTLRDLRAGSQRSLPLAEAPAAATALLEG
ncbi:MAG TPA: histidine--tRNA ligase [Ktedonobacterales bacterium]|nr:histidine--tRNA ligase [Ktedonobacterales bacterium]